MQELTEGSRWRTESTEKQKAQKSRSHEVALHEFVPPALDLQEQLDDFADRAVSAGLRRDDVCVFQHLGHRIRRRNGQTHAPEQRDIDHVVTHVGDRLEVDAFAADERLERAELVVGFLDEELDLQLLDATLERGAAATRDDADLPSRSPPQHDAVTVVDVEALRFLAVRHRVDGAVGHHSVAVEEEVRNSRGTCRHVGGVDAVPGHAPSIANEKYAEHDSGGTAPISAPLRSMSIRYIRRIRGPSSLFELHRPTCLTHSRTGERIAIVRVALESTVICHGLPRPLNLATARACESAVRTAGARPSTIAIVEGSVRIGLSDNELAELSTRLDVAKVSLQNLGTVCASGRWGATTVAATAHLAVRDGIRVFSTGGIGGVHRDAETSFDISADLTAVSSTPILVVCSGAKSILDLPCTIEVLETLGVPVVGWRTDEFPGFYARETGLGVTARAESAEDIAEIASAHWALGCRTAVLVVVPCPEAAAIARSEIDAIVDEALAESYRQGVRGAATTPFLLAHVAQATGGRALAANTALLENNARIAGLIAVALDR